MAAVLYFASQEMKDHFLVPLSFYFVFAEKGLSEPMADVLYFKLQETNAHLLVPLSFYFISVEKGLTKDPPPVPERVEPYSFVASNH
jgi:hypothetical protein